MVQVQLSPFSTRMNREGSLVRKTRRTQIGRGRVTPYRRDLERASSCTQNVQGRRPGAREGTGEARVSRAQKFSLAMTSPADGSAGGCWTLRMCLMPLRCAFNTTETVHFVTHYVTRNTPAEAVRDRWSRHGERSVEAG